MAGPKTHREDNVRTIANRFTIFGPGESAKHLSALYLVVGVAAKTPVSPDKGKHQHAARVGDEDTFCLVASDFGTSESSVQDCGAPVCIWTNLADRRIES